MYLIFATTRTQVSRYAEVKGQQRLSRLRSSITGLVNSWRGT